MAHRKEGENIIYLKHFFDGVLLLNLKRGQNSWV